MPLVVYKSSAGSGKTTTLVQAYLKITLNNPGLFRNVLAITFTNKAANEMKSRVLEWLKILSDNTLEKPNELSELQHELAYTDEVIQEKAQKLLSLVIHNYDEFSISTIDSFVHRIIKTFATDIQLPQNFEVVIEEDEIIPEIIQDLYEKVGFEKDITNILINFVIANFEDEKAHDPTNQLYKFIQKQIQEEGFFFINKMRDVSLADFHTIIQKLRKRYRELKNQISQLSCEAIHLIQKTGIEPASFYQGKRGIYTYFLKTCGFKNDKDIIPNSYVIKTIEEDNWYSSKCEADQHAGIDSIKDRLAEIFRALVPVTKQYIFYSLVYRKIYDVALIKEIRLLFDDYAERNQKVHISEFNKKISESIAGQPVPFIYERLGRRYRYFLIDEFQDTSLLQWQNLLPLLEESLAHGHFNMLVGDAKQAIYRFRNGEVELFSNLPKLYPEAQTAMEKSSEKFLEAHYKEVVLGTNFRSGQTIVDFNNHFFQAVKDDLQGNNKKVYAGHIQTVLPEKAKKKEGFVKIELVEAEKVETYREQRLDKIRTYIDELKSNGYDNKDICVLTNQHKYATEIASYMIGNGYNIVSHESLLLKNAPEVRLIIAFIKLYLDVEDKIQLANFIENMSLVKPTNKAFHKLFANALPFIEKGFQSVMHHLGFGKVTESNMAGLSPYELVEYAIHNLFGETNNNIFLHFFSNFAYDNQHVGDGSLTAFITYWEKKCDKTYITMPEGVNAIQVMTIHKAKGLKFESVILDIIPRNDKTTRKDYWTDLEIEGFEELKAGMLPIGKELDFIGLEHIYTEEFDKTELDLLNMIYVAFTRPVSAMYILSHKKEKSQNRYTTYIEKFLTSMAFNTDANEFKWGNLQKPFTDKKDEKKENELDNEDVAIFKDLLSSDWKGKVDVAPTEPIFWEQIESTPARTYGKLLHSMLSEIFLATDVIKVVQRYQSDGIIDVKEVVTIQNLLNKVVQHEELKPFFSEGAIIKNETELITLDNGNKIIQRPDRVVIEGNELVIIDYKTGAKSNSYVVQIQQYANCFSKLGYEKIRKILVYLNDDIEIKNV
ncbi:MAG: UvrD-helicase domain-containing protein [Bacteroidetes bacterium]|nr:UvrD-helicase domain-containing protein [Bacteroidota bacterium]